MKSQKTAQEQFVLTVLQLKDMIESNDVDSLDQYQEGLFTKIKREASSNFSGYSQSLISQILAEIQNSIAENLRAFVEPSLRLNKGSRIKNDNIRLFCETPDLVPGKYALLLVNKLKNIRHFFVADYFVQINGKKTFQIDFKMNPTAKDLTEGAYYAHELASLTPYLRSFVAASQRESSVLTAIARGNIGAYFPQDEINDLGLTTLFSGLNVSQFRVLSEFTRLPQGLQIMKGPPGTGKSTTIVSIISELCEESTQTKINEPILVCGPSNKSVAVIAQSFQKKFPTIPIVFCEREQASNANIISLPEKKTLEAKVIFVTLSKAGSSRITKYIKKIQALIIDEAGQASEPDMLIPFQFNPNKVLIVGDECQLPPTVSENLKKFNHHWSMLERLIVQCQQPHFLLDTQYRMHPEISEHPTTVYYNGQVNDGVTAFKRKPRGELEPYKVINVVNSAEEDPEKNLRLKGKKLKGYINEAEAEVVIKLLRDVLSKGYQASEISIITPYKAQAALLKILVAEILEIDNLAINTVDSFQGEENLVVFVSMVRANTLARLTFFEDFRRLNVAITRPKEVLRVLMNGATFNPLHPRNEFQNSLLQVFSEFHRIPLPGNDEFQKYYEDQDYDDYSNHQIQLSDNGYRRGLKDYSRDYRFHGLIHSDVIPNQRMVDHIWNDIYKHLSKRNVYIYGSNNGIYLYRKKKSTYALIVHDSCRHEILNLSNIRGAKHYINKLAWPEKGSFNDVGNFCLIKLDWKFADLIARNCKDLLFNGPDPMYRFAKLLRHIKDNIPNTIGKLPIFFLSTLPKGTHIIQDILNHMKVWENLSFVGLSDDIFSPFRYNTLAHISEAFEDYGYPFDEGYNYLSCGYSIGHNDYDEQEIEVENLLFERHRFYRCDLSGVNFHNSKFINTTFEGCNLSGCKVNLSQMDKSSKKSFLKNSARNFKKIEALPTDRLVLDAIKRGVYSQYSNDQSSISTSLSLKILSESSILDEKSIVEFISITEKQDDATNFSHQEIGDFKQAKQASLLLVEQQGKISPRSIEDWQLQDVDDKGNCFYLAIIKQMETINHYFLSTIPSGTMPHDSLRLRIQGRNFMDREWADAAEIFAAVRQLNVIVAIVDTRHPHLGFRCYYLNDIGDVNETFDSAQVPTNKSILRLAFTGNHYLSVHHHPSLANGALRRSFADPRAVICNFVESFWRRDSRTTFSQQRTSQRISKPL